MPEKKRTIKKTAKKRTVRDLVTHDHGGHEVLDLFVVDDKPAHARLGGPDDSDAVIKALGLDGLHRLRRRARAALADDQLAEHAHLFVGRHMTMEIEGDVAIRGHEPGDLGSGPAELQGEHGVEAGQHHGVAHRIGVF